MRRLPAIVGVVSVLAWAGGVAILIYLWIELGNRGEVADATQTAGYTTNAEIVAGVLGLGLIGFAVVGFFVTAFLWRRGSDCYRAGPAETGAGGDTKGTHAARGHPRAAYGGGMLQLTERP